MKITMAMTDKAIAKELFERLEANRQASGMSQETLAENLGISRPTYSRLQKGTCSLGTFIAVLRALDLLEGLNLLVPVQAPRPSVIVNARKMKRRGLIGRVLSSSSTVESKPRAMAAQGSVREMLERRQKNKVPQ
ncbi:TPA: helix-turn-helix transcriptional regulator [Aeromonas sobria]|nr:helix-turn-helix transcriptional regulator [Aeromonas sobria]